MSKEEVDECIFDYTIENKGRTHILVVEFPDTVDEECFLISLKAYLRAESERLTSCHSKEELN